MYLTNIEQLKKDLLAGEVSEKQSFDYFFIVFAFSVFVSEALGYFPGSTNHSLWDYLLSLGLVAFPVCGTYFAFQANGGDFGQDFFRRYFSLSWVLGVRFAGFALAISVWSMGITLYWSSEYGFERQRTAVEVLAWIIWLAAFYGQLCSHFRELKEKSKPL